MKEFPSGGREFLFREGSFSVLIFVIGGNCSSGSSHSFLVRRALGIVYRNR